ncbi:hypothetical protein [Pectobacterium wasabiae]|uniref:DUF2523 domain-containing protein n=1 Tax=Pectobacterium wasabiae TaxID=55208 RepID=A0AAW3EJ73_9GAMM|nr:hypothetical protein [Pectobacterium wasabiae]AOR63993.1 hypothetical protein A7983_12145 [Pectobacterium wasabiae CFBP 3304]EJS94390.1 Hypothetical protein Y17_2444 [Pectobacterium wasabiae CFBP 3304]KFX08614.1 hypothetical protein JV38_07775 [Pectobacterium wasabiae]KGA28641.1 hypothetical protein KU73_11495 [Pectobacterium wasabiae]
MKLTNNMKLFIRWLLILLVFGIYFGKILLITLDFGITKKYQEAPYGNSISVETCRAIAKLYEGYFDQLLTVSFTGALIAMVLILIIFKKVR